MLLTTLHTRKTLGPGVPVPLFLTLNQSQNSSRDGRSSFHLPNWKSLFGVPYVWTTHRDCLPLVRGRVKLRSQLARNIKASKVFRQKAE